MAHQMRKHTTHTTVLRVPLDKKETCALGYTYSDVVRISYPTMWKSTAKCHPTQTPKLLQQQYAISIRYRYRVLELLCLDAS